MNSTDCSVDNVLLIPMLGYIKVYWYIGDILVTDTLVYWYTDTLVYWYIGILVH